MRQDRERDEMVREQEKEEREGRREERGRKTCHT